MNEKHQPSSHTHSPGGYMVEKMTFILLAAMLAAAMLMPGCASSESNISPQPGGAQPGVFAEQTQGQQDSGTEGQPQLQNGTLGGRMPQNSPRGNGTLPPNGTRGQRPQMNGTFPPGNFTGEMPPFGENRAMREPPNWNGSFPPAMPQN